jgi:hypothetical protein
VSLSESEPQSVESSLPSSSSTGFYVKETEILQNPAFVTGCDTIQSVRKSAHEYTHIATYYINLVPTAPTTNASAAVDEIISHSIFQQGLLILALYESITKFYRKYCALSCSLSTVFRQQQHTYTILRLNCISETETYIFWAY